VWFLFSPFIFEKSNVFSSVGRVIKQYCVTVCVCVEGGGVMTADGGKKKPLAGN
jgi:hypothetical protein